MKKDKLYHLLVSRMQEAAVVPPQNLGSFTYLYKRIVPQFKVRPWFGAGVISLIFTFLAYLLFGATLIKVASLLQFGF